MIMEEGNIHFNVTGFLKNAEYSFHVLPFLLEYKNSFGNAELLTLNLEEIHSGFENLKRTEQFIFSEDGKKVEINITFQKFSDTKGQITGVPEASQVFETLGFVFDKVIYEYYSKFGQEINQRFTDYDANDIETIKNKILLFGIGRRDVADNRINKIIVGQITAVYLSSNSPHIPTGVDITLNNGNVQKVSVYEVKNIYRI